MADHHCLAAHHCLATGMRLGRFLAAEVYPADLGALLRQLIAAVEVGLEDVLPDCLLLPVVNGQSGVATGPPFRLHIQGTLHEQARVCASTARSHLSVSSAAPAPIFLAAAKAHKLSPYWCHFAETAPIPVM